jgi:hypothetical protein
MRNLSTAIASMIFNFRKLFKNLMEKSGIENDQQYDWMPLLNKKMEE